jgi:hypothetical protein
VFVNGIEFDQARGHRNALPGLQKGPGSALHGSLVCSSAFAREDLITRAGTPFLREIWT